jgi:prolyl 4-hydroxylase
MKQKHTHIPDDWVNWIRLCYEKKSDFMQMMKTLREHFDDTAVYHWVSQIWQHLDVPLNSEYNLDHSWLNVENKCVGGIEIQHLHQRPTVAVFKNILSEAECDTIVNSYIDSSRETRASVYDNNTGGSRIDNARTNTLTHINYGEHPVVVELEKRIAKVTNLHVQRGESCQLLHYQSGEQYTPHDDFFHSNGASSNISAYGQRLATVITYLNDVDEGGETDFPNLGITVPPTKGDALYFEYTDPEGCSTTLCRHAGMPVLQGEKWAITKWLRLGFPMPSEHFLASYSRNSLL